MGVVTLPPGTSQDRTEQVLAEIDSLVRSSPAVETSTMISGYSFMGGQGSSYGSFIVKLKPWDERSLKQGSTIVAVQLLLKSLDVFKNAQVLFFQPPMIMGYLMVFRLTYKIELVEAWISFTKSLRSSLQSCRSAQRSNQLRRHLIQVSLNTWSRLTKLNA